MKRKFVFAFMVVLLCSMPIYLTGQSTYPNIRPKIGICVESMVVDKDQHLGNLVKGHFLQSLRQIPDVIVVDRGHGMYRIRFMATETTPGFYTIAYVVTMSLGPEISVIKAVVPEPKDIVNHLFKDACLFLGMGIFYASPQTLELQCKNFIVRFDSQYLQELRNSDQQLIRKIPKNENP